MKPKVYIDGKDGTTGLQIYDRLAARDDIGLLLIDEAKRKDPDERKRLMAEADIVFLCLPDAAAITAADLVENPDTVVLDTSTAHRTAPGWTSAPWAPAPWRAPPIPSTGGRRQRPWASPHPWATPWTASATGTTRWSF